MEGFGKNFGKKLRVAALAATLGLSATKAAANEVENTDKIEPETEATEQADVKHEPINVASLANSTIVVPKAENPAFVNAFDIPVEFQKKEVTKVETQQPTPSENERIKRMTQEIVEACFGLEKDNCLKTVVETAKSGALLEKLIPFKSGITSIGKALNDKSMAAGERVGSVLRGIFDLVTDAATLKLGGKGLIKLATAYRAVNTAEGAYTMYIENKEAIHARLDQLFGKDTAERKRVSDTLATLETVGKITSAK